MSEAENWAPFPGYEDGYEVSDLGRWRSIDRVVVRTDGWVQTFKGKILVPKKGRDGYLRVVVRRVCEKRKFVRLHRAVYEAFIGPIPDGFEINHVNGIKTDNRLSNLELATRHGNMRHARDVLGKIGKQKLSREQAGLIKTLHAFNNRIYSQKALAEHFGVSVPTVSNIKTGALWSDLETSCPYEARRRVPHRLTIQIFNADGSLSNTLTKDLPAEHWEVCVY